MRKYVITLAVAAGVALVAATAYASNIQRTLQGKTILRATDTTSNAKVLSVKNAANTEKFYVDIDGDCSCHDLTVGGTFSYSAVSATTVTASGAAALNGGITVDTTNFTVDGTSGAVHTAAAFDVATDKFTVSAAGVTHVAGNFDVATPMFTVNASSGATHIAGNLDVASPNFTVAASTGATHVAGNFDVATPNFTVAASTGATHVAGNFDVATSKFTVASGTGNTVVAGTLQSGAAISGTSLATVKGIMTFTSSSVDVASISANAQVCTDIALTGVAAGDACFLTTTGSALDAGLVCTCRSKTDNLTLCCANSVDDSTAIDPAAKTYTFLVIDLT